MYAAVGIPNYLKKRSARLCTRWSASPTSLKNAVERQPIKVPSDLRKPEDAQQTQHAQNKGHPFNSFRPFMEQQYAGQGSCSNYPHIVDGEKGGTRQKLRLQGAKQKKQRAIINKAQNQSQNQNRRLPKGGYFFPRLK